MKKIIVLVGMLLSSSVFATNTTTICMPLDEQLFACATIPLKDDTDVLIQYWEAVNGMDILHQSPGIMVGRCSGKDEVVTFRFDALLTDGAMVSYEGTMDCPLRDELAL